MNFNFNLTDDSMPGCALHCIEKIKCHSLIKETSLNYSNALNYLIYTQILIGLAVTLYSIYKKDYPNVAIGSMVMLFGITALTLSNSF